MGSERFNELFEHLHGSIFTFLPVFEVFEAHTVHQGHVSIEQGAKYFHTPGFLVVPSQVYIRYLIMCSGGQHSRKIRKYIYRCGFTASERGYRKFLWKCAGARLSGITKSSDV